MIVGCAARARRKLWSANPCSSCIALIWPGVSSIRPAAASNARLGTSSAAAGGIFHVNTSSSAATSEPPCRRRGDGLDDLSSFPLPFVGKPAITCGSPNQRQIGPRKRRFALDRVTPERAPDYG